VNTLGLSHRVTISEQNLHELLPLSSLVISEDTTAGMEAMFWGKILVHAHFTASEPTLPIVAYGAALPANCAEELVSSILKAQQLTIEERHAIQKGQAEFIRDFAGVCDGSAGARVLSCLEDLLGARVS
jgi:hypothetical protein